MEQRALGPEVILDGAKRREPGLASGYHDPRDSCHRSSFPDLALEAILNV